MKSFRPLNVANSVAMAVTKSMRFALRIKWKKTMECLFLESTWKEIQAQAPHVLQKKPNLRLHPFEVKTRFFSVNASILKTLWHVLSEDSLYETPIAHWLSSGYQASEVTSQFSQILATLDTLTLNYVAASYTSH